MLISSYFNPLISLILELHNSGADTLPTSITFVTSHISAPGGAERSVHELAVELTKLGWSVTLASIYGKSYEDENDPTLRFLIDNGISVQYAGVSRSLRFILLPLVLMRLKRILSASDHVECSLLAPSVYCLTVNLILKRTIILGIRHVYRMKYENNLIHKLFRLLVSFNYNRDRLKLYAISYFAKCEFGKYSGISQESIKTIYNSVTIPKTQSISRDLLSELKLDKHKKVILYCGRITRYKNIEMLLEAFELFASTSNGENYILVLVGDIDSSIQGKDILTDRVLSKLDNITFFRFVGPVYDVHPYFQLAKAIIHPSLTEAFGRVVLESYGHGKPVIVSNVDALPEVSAGGGAIYFDPFDINSLVRALHLFSNLSDSEYLRYCEMSLKRYSDFGLQKRASQMIDLAKSSAPDNHK